MPKAVPRSSSSTKLEINVPLVTVVFTEKLKPVRTTIVKGRCL